MLIRKILVIQFRPFGDVLLASSYAEALKNHFPNAQIHYLCNPPFHTVIEDHPLIDQIHTTPYVGGFWRYWQIKAWLKVRKERYDLIIDQQSSTESKLFLLLSRAPYRLSWGYSSLSFLCNLKAPIPPNIYNAQRNLYMLRPLGIMDTDCRLQVSISQKGKEMVQVFLEKNDLVGKKLIGIEASCKDPRKRWHLEGFIALIEGLLERTEANLVLLSAPAERPHLEQIAERIKNSRLFLAPQTPTLREAAAFLQTFDLLICHEGAMNHLSCATETPALCLIGVTDPEVWSPQGFFPKHQHLRNPAWKMQDEPHDFGLSAAEILEKALEMLEERSF